MSAKGILFSCFFLAVVLCIALAALSACEPAAYAQGGYFNQCAQYNTPLRSCYPVWITAQREDGSYYWAMLCSCYPLYSGEAWW